MYARLRERGRTKGKEGRKGEKGSYGSGRKIVIKRSNGKEDEAGKERLRKGGKEGRPSKYA